MVVRRSPFPFSHLQRRNTRSTSTSAITTTSGRPALPTSITIPRLCPALVPAAARPDRCAAARRHPRATWTADGGPTTTTPLRGRAAAMTIAADRPCAARRSRGDATTRLTAIHHRRAATTPPTGVYHRRRAGMTRRIFAAAVPHRRHATTHQSTAAAALPHRRCRADTIPPARHAQRTMTVPGDQR